MTRMIYVDMDEVVADFRAWARANLKESPVGERYGTEAWNKIRSYPRVYRDLPLKEGANELIAWVKNYCRVMPNTGMAFLSAIPKGNDMPWSVQDKVWWAHRYFPGVPVFLGPYSVDKKSHCRPGDVLIDDRSSNGKDWIEAGGIWHQYRDWPTCHEWLVKELPMWVEP